MLMSAGLIGAASIWNAISSGFGCIAASVQSLEDRLIRSSAFRLVSTHCRTSSGLPYCS